MPWIRKPVRGTDSRGPAWWARKSVVRRNDAGLYCTASCSSPTSSCRFFRTSLRRRRQRASYFRHADMASGIGRAQLVRAPAAAGSGAARGLAASPPPSMRGTYEISTARNSCMWSPASECASLRMLSSLGMAASVPLAACSARHTALRGCRHVEMRDAGLAQCVEHCIHQGTASSR